MANAILAYANQIDNATLSGGSWVSTLPLTNLQDRRLGRLARSTDALEASTTFDIDLGSTRLLRVFALCGHNFSTAATRRFRFSAVADFSSVVLDTGWVDVWPEVYPFGTVGWGSPNFWSGRYSEEEIAGYNASAVHIFDQSTNARYVRVEISDEANLSGYVQMARVFVGDGWQPTRNMVYGASIGWIDRTGVQEARSGAEYFDIQRMPRVARFDLPAMSESEAMSNAFDLQRAMGTAGEMFFIWDPDDSTHALRRQFLCRLRGVSPITNPGPDRWSAPWEAKELL
jgi:hypothetical protein